MFIEHNGYKLNTVQDNYVMDNSTALMLYTDEGEPYCTATVWLESVGEDMAYLDTNNCPWIEGIMSKYNLGHPTGYMARSGFCEYPLYVLNLDEIAKYRKKIGG